MSISHQLPCRCSAKAPDGVRPRQTSSSSSDEERHLLAARVLSKTGRLPAHHHQKAALWWTTTTNWAVFQESSNLGERNPQPCALSMSHPFLRPGTFIWWRGKQQVLPAPSMVSYMNRVHLRGGRKGLTAPCQETP